MKPSRHGIFLAFRPAREAFDGGRPVRLEARFWADALVDATFFDEGLNSFGGFDGRLSALHGHSTMSMSDAAIEVWFKCRATSAIPAV